MRARYAQLDGLRAIAALSVFATHAAFLTGFTHDSALGHLTAQLNVGVALFFVLSGFLLYRPWAAARLGDGTSPALGGYAVRRALRILPAYWVALLVLGVLAGDQVPGVFGDRWWAYFGLLQVYGQDTIIGGIAPAWSLSTELAFYVLLPFYAAGTAWLLRGRRNAVALEVAGLAVSALVAFAVLRVALHDDWLSTYPNTLPGRWPWFAAGLALAVLSASPRRPRIGRPWAWWLAAAAALAVCVIVLPKEVFAATDRDAQVTTFLFTVIAGCLLAPLVLAEGGPARLLSTRVLVWLGTVSYGVFLWHYPVIKWYVAKLPDAPDVVVWVLSLATVLAIATASWHLVERPLMRLGSRRSQRPDRDAAAGAPVLEPAP